MLNPSITYPSAPGDYLVVILYTNLDYSRHLLRGAGESYTGWVECIPFIDWTECLVLRAHSSGLLLTCFTNVSVSRVTRENCVGANSIQIFPKVASTTEAGKRDQDNLDKRKLGDPHLQRRNLKEKAGNIRESEANSCWIPQRSRQGSLELVRLVRR